MFNKGDILIKKANAKWTYVCVFDRCINYKYFTFSKYFSFCNDVLSQDESNKKSKLISYELFESYWYLATQYEIQHYEKILNKKDLTLFNYKTFDTVESITRKDFFAGMALQALIIKGYDIEHAIELSKEIAYKMIR